MHTIVENDAGQSGIDWSELSLGCGMELYSTKKTVRPYQINLMFHRLFIFSE